MTLPFIPADQDARCRIRDSLDENLLVEAGAGTGKTTSLVERIAQLIVRGASLNYTGWPPSPFLKPLRRNCGTGCGRS